MYEWSLKWGTRVLGPKEKILTFDLQLLDKHLGLFVPSLFSEIKIVDNEVIVKVPNQVALKIAEHLRDCYHIQDPIKIKIIGV